MKSKKNVLSFLGAGFLTLLVLWGTSRAFVRGGNDFSVFYQAWKWALVGQGLEIYRSSPDRFLYHPGFAWLLAPLALFSKPVSLAVWCAAKAAVLVFLIKKLSEPWTQGRDTISRSKNSSAALTASLFGILLVSKPLLIDLEYGQVNLFILAACVSGLTGHFDPRKSSVADVVGWVVLTFAALAKLFPLPLLLVPFFVTEGFAPKKLRFERIGILIGVLIIFALPVLGTGWAGSLQLLSEWRDALFSRGLPLETHNQSFTALLYHYLSGEPTHVVSEAQSFVFGKSWLSSTAIEFLSLGWSFLTLGLSLGWIISGSRHSPAKWIAIAIGFLIIPSHLVWKPYFVMSLPLAVLVMQTAFQGKTLRLWTRWVFPALLFVGINLTGFDFVGHQWGALLEAASVLLLIHLLMMLNARLAQVL